MAAAESFVRLCVLVLAWVAVASCLDRPSHGTPKVANLCGHCKNKLDFGKEFICCTECSDPYILNEDSKLGYCKTGAELAMQLKPHETFHWVAGPWMKCSSPCDGGVRYGDIACYGSLESSDYKRTGTSGWLVALIVLSGTTGAIAFAGHTYYMSRNSGRSGFVYVMMEAYS